MHIGYNAFQLFIMLYVVWVGKNKAGGEIWPAPLGWILRAGNVMGILQDGREEYGGGGEERNRK